MLRIRCAIPKRRLDAGLAFKTSQYNVSVCCNSRLSEAPYPGQQLFGMCTRRDTIVPQPGIRIKSSVVFVLGLIALGALVSPIVSASIGVAALFATYVQPWSAIPLAWFIYWLGDAMGVLLLGPAWQVWVFAFEPIDADEGLQQFLTESKRMERFNLRPARMRASQGIGGQTPGHHEER